MGASKTYQFSDRTNSIAKIASAISHPARVHIIDVIRENGFVRNVDLGPILNLSISTIHTHVSKLKNADIVQLEFYPNGYCLKLNPSNLAYLEIFLQNEEYAV